MGGGIAYHVLNGLGFAIGYTIVVRRPGLISAVVWAMVLETFTILLYPDWLGLTAVGEFFSIRCSATWRTAWLSEPWRCG